MPFWVSPFARADVAETVNVLAAAMAAGGLTRLEVEGLVLERSPAEAAAAAAALEAERMVQGAAEQAAAVAETPAAKELAAKLKAASQVSDLDILLNPFSGLEGMTTSQG